MAPFKKLRSRLTSRSKGSNPSTPEHQNKACAHLSSVCYSLELISLACGRVWHAFIIIIILIAAAQLESAPQGPYRSERLPYFGTLQYPSRVGICLQFQSAWLIFQRRCHTWPQRSRTQHMDGRHHHLVSRSASKPRTSCFITHLVIWLFVGDTVTWSKRSDA